LGATRLGVLIVIVFENRSFIYLDIGNIGLF